MFTSRIMDKQTAKYSYSKLILSKKKQITKTYKNGDEFQNIRLSRSHIQRPTL